MIGLLLISHGKMAAGMLDSLQLIMGETDQMDAIALAAGQDFDSFKTDVIKRISALDAGEGVLIFVDLFGASPYNAAQYAKHILQGEDVMLRIITGMSLPMLLETAVQRGGSTLDELVEIAIRCGREGIDEPVIVVEEEDGEYE